MHKLHISSSPLVRLVSAGLGPALVAVPVISFPKVGRHGVPCSRVEMLFEVITLHFLSVHNSKALVTGSPGLLSPGPHPPSSCYYSAASANLPTIWGDWALELHPVLKSFTSLSSSWPPQWARCKPSTSVLTWESNIVQTISSE